MRAPYLHMNEARRRASDIVRRAEEGVGGGAVSSRDKIKN